jgi:hypothetical protein
MTTSLTLTLPPSFGNKTIEVDLKRFSIGRTPENDLEIDDGSLSRRHALIEEFDGKFTLSDCGSSNGTFVNGQQVTTPIELSDWDVLTFGGVSDVLVRIEGDPSSREHSEAQPIPAPGYQRQHKSTNSDNHLFKPLIALAAAALILTITGVVLFVYNKQDTSSIKVRQRGTDHQNNNAMSTSTAEPTGTAASVASPSSENPNGQVESNQLVAIEGYASRVLSSISRDTKPVLTEKPLSAISSKVEGYRNSSSLESDLRTMKRALPQVSALARAHNVRTPLAVYATLARIDRNGGRGDPAQVAAAVCPALARMRDVFGDELANDSLLAVAGMEEGADLQGRITRLAGRVSDSPTTIRSVWYLHDHQVISNQTYDFVLRLLAIGVISQDPSKFGISVEPIVF